MYAKDVLVETSWVEEHLDDGDRSNWFADYAPATFRAAQAVRPDGTFKPRELYTGVLNGAPIIANERSAS